MPRIVPSQVVVFIDQFFKVVNNPPPDNQVRLGRDSAPHLKGLVAMIENIPQELIQISGQDFSDLIVATEGLRNAVETWASQGDVEVKQSIGEESHIFMLRRALANCPDEAPAAETADLLFLEPKELREEIRIDISSANISLHSCQWKAATVLAGAAAESLLLWSIQRQSAQITDALTALRREGYKSLPNNADPNHWTLPQYIEVALQLDIIDKNTATQARLAKDYRNLIHPGLAARQEDRCDRAAALTAIAAVEHIIRNLSVGRIS